MYIAIGKKKQVAFEIEIIDFEPYLMGKTTIWINGEPSGKYTNTYLTAFINQIAEFAWYSEKYWDSEFDKLICSEIFFKIHPFFNKPEALENMSDEEYQPYRKYEKYNAFWGVNFDRCVLDTVIKNNICTFLYFVFPAKGLPVTADDKSIMCAKIELDTLVTFYKEICRVIPDKYWSKKYKKMI